MSGRAPVPAAPRIVVRVTERRWRLALPDAAQLARRAAQAAFAVAEVSRHPRGSAEASITLASDAAVRRLNRDWRGRDQPTNVLSFAAEAAPAPAPAHGAPPVLLGDVVLALGTTAAEAGTQGKALGDHARHLVVHGVLHLLGYDHEDDAEAATMESLEIRALAGLGVGDPYRPRRARRIA